MKLSELGLDPGLADQASALPALELVEWYGVFASAFTKPQVLEHLRAAAHAIEEAIRVN